MPKQSVCIGGSHSLICSTTTGLSLQMLGGAGGGSGAVGEWGSGGTKIRWVAAGCGCVACDITEGPTQ